MIRKSTWITLAVFIVLAGIATFLLRAPNSPIQPKTPTPAASLNQATLITGWKNTDITAAELNQAIGGVFRIERNPDGTWTENKAVAVSIGDGEELLTELLGLQIQAALPADYALDSIGLAEPAGIHINVEGKDGRKLVLAIGLATPTDSGYYVRVDQNPPAVVSKGSLENVYRLFYRAAMTPTPPATAATAASP